MAKPSSHNAWDFDTGEVMHKPIIHAHYSFPNLAIEKRKDQTGSVSHTISILFAWVSVAMHPQHVI